MSRALEIIPVRQPVEGSVRPPGSKSLTNRALIVAALAKGTSRLTGMLHSRDTEVMVEALRQLGISLEHDPTAGTVTVTGCRGRPPAQQADLWLENSGTSIRFLTAFCAPAHGTFRLDGNERMRQRPIADLLDALCELGVDAVSEQETGCPPVVIRADGFTGGETTVAGDVSSQFLSGLLMAAPCARSPVTINVRGTLVSQPYVDMTLGVMRAFGVTVERGEVGSRVEGPESRAPASGRREPAGAYPEDDASGSPGALDPPFVIQPQVYQAREYQIEPDASAASYFLASAAITGGRVTVQGLSRRSLQGDVAFADVLQSMGCRVEWDDDAVTVSGGPLHGIDVDMNAISDTAQTLCAVAVFADGPTRIRNIAHVRHKETDRIAAVATELRRLGIDVDETEGGLTIHPSSPRGGVVTTYDDHRMAMSFALLGLKVPGIRIAHPECVAKTYPQFFDDLQHLRRQSPPSP